MTGCAVVHGGTYDKVDDEEASSAEHQTLASTISVDNVRRYDGPNDANGVQSSGKTALLDRTVTCLAEQHRRVCSDSSDTRPRSHYLQPYAQPSSATQMGALCPVKTKDDLDKFEWRTWLGSFSDSHNIVELLLHFWTEASSNMFKYFLRLCCSTNGRQVTR